MRIRVACIVSLICVFTLAAACGPPPPPRVTRLNPNEQTDLSGKWNDTDSNLVARAMIQDCLSRPWASKFKEKTGKDPVIRLELILNRAPEHINTRFFTKQVEAEILNSGMAQVVADTEEAEGNRDERADQAQHASDETAKSQGNETGSDFLLKGWILTENDALGSQEVRAFVITMELTNSETNVKVWMKVHKIKKVINRASTRW